MSKLKNNKDLVLQPLSDWDIYPWDNEMYKKHESDFKKILMEYREQKMFCNNDTKMARWRWIENKSGMSIKKDEFGFYIPNVIVSKYQNISNMFERFNDWLSFREKIENTPEQLHSKRSAIINDIKSIMGRTDFSISKNIIDSAKIEAEYQNENHDDIIQHALDNF